MAESWISGAIKHPGALTKKAKAMGHTIEQHCAMPNLSGKTQRQCELAKTLRGFKKK